MKAKINEIVTQAAGAALDDTDAVDDSFGAMRTTVRNFSIRQWHVPLDLSIRTPTL